MTKKKESSKKSSSEEKSFLNLSKKASFGWSCLGILLLAWMFALGTIVGRSTAPVDVEVENIEKELSVVKGKIGDKPGNDLLKMPEKPDLVFYEALKDNSDAPVPVVAPEKKSEVKEDKKESKKPTKKTLKPKADKKKASKKKEEKPAVKKKVKVEKKTDKSTAVKKSQPKLSPKGKKYTIQAAALKDAGDAKKLVTDLKKKGYPAYSLKAKLSTGDIWYRVRIGYYAGKKEAEGMLKKLKKNQIEAYLVKI